MGAIYSSSIDMALTGPEKGRIHKLFQMMDYDKSGTIECDEICTVHDSDKDNMIRMLDTNGDNVVDKAEWTAYMESKKAEKGETKFEFFLKYLEKEIPKKIPAMKVQHAKKQKNPAAAKKAIKAAKAPQAKAKQAVEEEDLADILFECPHKAAGVPVPESVQKKRDQQEKLRLAAREEASVNRASRKAKRQEAYNNAQEYCKEYRALARQQVRMRRQAKAAGNHFVEAEAKLIFVVRIRGQRYASEDQEDLADHAPSPNEHGSVHEGVQGSHRDADACRAVRELWLPEHQVCQRSHLQARIRQGEQEPHSPSRQPDCGG